MSSIWKKILILSAIAAFLALFIFFMFHLVPSPPINEIRYTQATLSLARRNGADSYSKKLYREAKVLYDSAMITWKKENERFIYSRNYEKVERFAELAAKKANQAGDNSKSNTTNLKSGIKKKITTLSDLIIDINDLFTRYPLTSETRNRISKGKFLLRESEIAWEKGQYLQADKKITESEYLLTASYEDGYENLKTYFRSYPEWKTWADSAIAESRETQDYSIIVDKYSKKVFVYLNGTKKYEYSVELGKNWVGDKRVRGDKATPEGKYRIAKKLNGNKTKYYKALLLNYPNDEDTASFRAEMAKGTLPRSAKIGDMIEIHGNGGKGVDWTEGCIALTDREMDSIFKIAKVGTPVTIVGSMNDFSHILNR